MILNDIDLFVCCLIMTIISISFAIYVYKIRLANRVHQVINMDEEFVIIEQIIEPHPVGIENTNANINNTYSYETNVTDLETIAEDQCNDDYMI